MGSRSPAPRGTSFWVVTDGTGGASGEGPRTEVGREILEFRRSRLLGEADVVGGAVCGVIGV